MKISDLTHKTTWLCPSCNSTLFYELFGVTDSGVLCDTLHPAVECRMCRTIYSWLLERQPDGSIARTSVQVLSR